MLVGQELFLRICTSDSIKLLCEFLHNSHSKRFTNDSNSRNNNYCLRVLKIHRMDMQGDVYEWKKVYLRNDK